ncbi:MAG: hypothetical protein EPO58_14065 [Chitinophagaceae bacterium]|nr:MAG: hypothetical protein EPO58_14065 [Chitinophagaceae bacterium]
MQRFDVIEFFRRFDKTQMFLLLQACSCHPSNQKYIHRFEHLIVLLLGIPETTFKKRTPGQSDIIFLFEKIRAQHDRDFGEIEDFLGFPQQKLIPLFYEQKMYHIFYSTFERPIENWQQLIDITVTTKNANNILSGFNEALSQSLQWQTDLLKCILIQDGVDNDFDEPYIPDEIFLESITPYFKAESDHIRMFFDPEAIAHLQEDDLLELAPNTGNLFNGLFVIIASKLYWVLPQVHYSVLSYYLAVIVNTDNAVRNDCWLGLYKRCQRQLLSAFHKSRRVVAITTPEQHELLCAPELIFLFDLNKIFHFEIIPHSHVESVSRTIEACHDATEGIMKEINSLETVVVFPAEEKVGMGILPENLEFHIIYVMENLQSNYTYEMKPGGSNWSYWYFEFGDLKQVLEMLETPLEFYKFLCEDKWLLEYCEMPSGSEFMDRFICYFKNGRTYSRMAELPDLIYFKHHQWSSHYHHKTFEQYTDNPKLYEEMALRFGNYDDLSRYRNNVYRLANTTRFEHLYLVQLPDRFIIIHLADKPLSLSYEEYRFGFEVLAAMFGDFLDRVGREVSAAMSSYGIDDISIYIFPEKYVSINAELFFLNDSIKELTTDNPFVFASSWDRKKKTVYCIYYHNNIHRYFDVADNHAERMLFKKLVEQIFSEEITEERDGLIDLLVETAAPVGKKGYAIDQVEISNIDIRHYQKPSQATWTDRGKVKRLIAGYLKDNGYEPRLYQGTEAINLAYHLYLYLQSHLEIEIRSCDPEIIIYAYRQLEYNEGQAENQKLQLGMQADRVTDYKIADRLKEWVADAVATASTIRYIIHACLKAKPEGNKYITESSWTYLMAMAEQIIQVAMLYDYIEYGLVNHTILINEYYEFQEMIAEGKFEMNGYLDRDAASKVNVARNAFKKATTNHLKTEVSEEYDDWEDEFSKIFLKQFGVSYSNIILVLYVLSKADYKTEQIFPANFASKERLTEIVLANVTIPINHAEIQTTIEFLTLKDGVFGPDQWLYHGVLLRKRQRLTLCPFIELQDGDLMFGREVLDGALIIWSDVTKGSLPFEVKENSEADVFLNQVRLRKGTAFEMKIREIAVAVLGKDCVETQIDNFKRISSLFNAKEDCGEIDLLCVNPNSKIIYVMDCKNLIKKLGLYQVNREIEAFFIKPDSHFHLLVRKTQFVEQHLDIILGYFKINDPTDWKIKNGFITSSVQFAAFYNNQAVDFILADELAGYLTA